MAGNGTPGMKNKPSSEDVVKENVHAVTSSRGEISTFGRHRFDSGDSVIEDTGKGSGFAQIKM